MPVDEMTEVRRQVRIAASPARVFRLYTDPDEMRRWMATDCELDPRPGGRYRVRIGERHHEVGQFLEVEPPHRIVHTYGWDGEDSLIPAGSSTVELTFEASDEGTLLTVVHRDLPRGASGAGKGWDHYLARMVAVAEDRDPGADPWAGPPATELVEREIRIEATPERIFPYLVEPDRIVAWMGVDVDVDARPGGIYRANVTGDHIARGIVELVDPPHRVVYTWGWEGGDSFLAPGASTVEFTLAADGEGTLVRMVHRVTSPELATSHAEGWDHYLPRLRIAATGGDPGLDPWTGREIQEG